MSAVIVPLIVAALVAAVIAMTRWIRSDGDPRNRPQPRPQDHWSTLPTSGYTTSAWFQDHAA